MDQREIVVRLLQRLAEAIGRSSPDDLALLISGKAGLVISSDTRKASGKPTKKAQRAPRELNELAAKLRGMVSRSEGLNLLNGAEFSRTDLEELARLMDLPVLRSDDVERLKQKIIEESIGARLNSEAIRGR